MIKLGITGSIGMGKSTIARLFIDEGVPVLQSDDTVHALLAKGGLAVEPVITAFPDTQAKDGSIDRVKLGRIVFNDDDAMRRLESILHPMVKTAQQHFFTWNIRHPSGIVAFDIPLLYETGAEQRLDKIVVVTAPAWLQRKRVLARKGMTQERLHAVLQRQMPDAEKRRRADYIVHTGLGLAHSCRQVKTIISILQQAGHNA